VDEGGVVHLNNDTNRYSKPLLQTQIEEGKVLIVKG